MNYRILGDYDELVPLPVEGKYRKYFDLHGHRDRVEDAELLGALQDSFFNHPNIVFANANNPRLKDTMRQSFLSFPEKLDEQIAKMLTEQTGKNGMLMFFNGALTTRRSITLCVGALPDTYLGMVRKAYIDEILKEL